MSPVEICFLHGSYLHEDMNINIWKIGVFITILFDNTGNNIGKAHVWYVSLQHV